MPLVRLIDDPFDLSGYSEHNVDNLLGFLAERYPVWPQTARLYHGSVAEPNDVTPATEEQLAQLADMDGPFYVVVYPGDPVTAIITTVAVLALTAAVLLFLTPKIPSLSNQDQASNNSLGQRVNKARPNARIEEIFGEVVSVPSLLTVPLLVFDNNLEVEYCFMCVGRGAYEISDVCDGNTPVGNIAGAGVSFYGPGSRPGNGEPFLKIGSDIDFPLKDVRRSNEVNGQILRVPTDGAYKGENNIRFVYPDTIQRTNNDVSFSDFFAADAALTVSGSTGPGGSLDGVYTMLAVDESTITLANPSAVNDNWDALEASGQTGTQSPLLEGVGSPTVGPFRVDHKGADELVFNFIAPQGIYRLNEQGKNRDRSVTISVMATPVNGDGTSVGPAVNGSITMYGNGNDRRPKGQTLRVAINPGAIAYVVSVSRLTGPFADTDETVVDEIRWRDLYSTASIALPDFGNVTTLHSRTYATAGATSVKERKLNCRAVRKLLQRNPDNTFGPLFIASRKAADIICHMALDPYIGGRELWELDVSQIYATFAEAQAYFGIPDVLDFGYTFDQDNVSFEEMVQSVAQAAFCTAYRQGSVLRLFFERATNDATLLFNHRNKVPGSETRTVRFGNLNDFDGVELDYVSGEDGAKLTLYVPEDRSAVKPKKIDLLGVIDRRGDAAVAKLHAMRAYNKIKYQNTTTEFTALGEASQLVVNELIHVTDNTRPDVWDGEVLGTDGLVLNLSQPFDGALGVIYTAFLQLPSGVVQSLPCRVGPGLYQATLLRPPREALTINVDAWANATYQIAPPDQARPNAFLVSEKGAYDNQTIQVQAINYDPRYYQNDHDFA